MNDKHLIGEPAVILLVEDNPAHAELIIRGLADGRIANRIIHVSDGEEVLKEIRASSLNGLPVAILTSSAADTDMAKAYKYHANSYLVKPPDFASFAKLMDDLGFYWLCWNKYPWKGAGKDKGEN